MLHQIVRMNVSDTRKLDQTKGARQSWSCSMEYSSFVYVYEHHLWIMRYMSLANRRRWLRRPPEVEDRLCWFYRGFFLSVFGFRFRFFSRNCLTLMSYNLVSYSVLQRSVTSFHVTCSVKDLLRALLQYLFNLRAARKRYSNYFQYNIFLRFLVDSAFFDPFQTSTHTWQRMKSGSTVVASINMRID